MMNFYFLTIVWGKMGIDSAWNKRLWRWWLGYDESREDHLCIESNNEVRDDLEKK